MTGEDIKFGCYNLYNLLSGNWKSAEVNQKPDSKATLADLKAYLRKKGTSGDYREGDDGIGPYLYAVNGNRYLYGSGKKNTKGICNLLAKDYRKFVDEYMEKDVIMRDPADFDDIPTSSKKMIEDRITEYLYNVREVVQTRQMVKGLKRERESVPMIQDHLKNRVFLDVSSGISKYRVTNDWLVGHTDVLPLNYCGKKWIMDIKNPYETRTFLNLKKEVKKCELKGESMPIPQPYRDQIQAYAWMTGSEGVMIAYTLNKTSQKAIDAECKRLFYGKEVEANFFELYDLFDGWMYSERAGGADSTLEDVNTELLSNTSMNKDQITEHLPEIVDLFKNWRQTHRNHDITVVAEKDRVLILRDEACKDWQGLAEWKLKRAQVYAHWVLENLMGIEVEPMEGAVESQAELPF